VSVEKSKLADDEDGDDGEDYSFDDIQYNNGGRPVRRAAKKSRKEDEDDDINMYVDGEDEDSLMEIDDPASDFEEDGKKKKTVRKPKEGVTKKAKWQDVCDEDGNDLEEKKKMRQLKKEQNDKKKAIRAAQKEA
jgi:hypothetical protein